MTDLGVPKDHLDPLLERNYSPKERTACLERLLGNYYMEQLSVFPLVHGQAWLIWWFVRETGGRMEALGRGRSSQMCMGFDVEWKEAFSASLLQLLNYMGGWSKDFLLGRVSGQFLFCFELPDSQQKTSVDLPWWFKPQSFNPCSETVSHEFSEWSKWKFLFWAKSWIWQRIWPFYPCRKLRKPWKPINWKTN